MSIKSKLLCTTVLTGVLLSFSLKAKAADLSLKAPAATPDWLAPAVDGYNWKLGALGGSLANRELFGTQGSFSIPVAHSVGLQLDEAAGSFDARYFGAAAAHLFWRDPSRGLLGLYGAHTHWDQFGGLDVSHAAVEGEAYLGRFTLQGIAGAEFGDSKTSIGPVVTTIYDGRTRFFDEINFAYYPIDEARVYVGHRYLGGKNAAALGGEVALPAPSSYLVTAFIEGRLGESNFHGLWGGLRFYWDQKGKSLIDRHRQDDPYNWLPETLFSITNALSSTPNATLPDGDGEGDADGEGDGDA